MPIVDNDLLQAHYSMRECVKQLVLLEDHLAHPNKQCPDCIHKHRLTAEAFADEACTLDGADRFPGIEHLGPQVRGCGTQREVRSLRKRITKDLRDQGLGSIFAEGLFSPEQATAYQVSQDMVLPAEQDPASLATPLAEYFGDSPTCPDGYRPFAYYAHPATEGGKMVVAKRCLRKSISPTGVSFYRDACPEGQVEVGRTVDTVHEGSGQNWEWNEWTTLACKPAAAAALDASDHTPALPPQATAEPPVASWAPLRASSTELLALAAGVAFLWIVGGRHGSR